MVTSSDDSKLEVARDLGAKHTINYKKTPDWDQQVLRIVRCFYKPENTVHEHFLQTNGLGVEHMVEVGLFGNLLALTLQLLLIFVVLIVLPSL